jgi:hypothetical protein
MEIRIEASEGSVLQISAVNTKSDNVIALFPQQTDAENDPAPQPECKDGVCVLTWKPKRQVA